MLSNVVIVVVVVVCIVIVVVVVVCSPSCAIKYWCVCMEKTFHKKAEYWYLSFFISRLDSRIIRYRCVCMEDFSHNEL